MFVGKGKNLQLECSLIRGSTLAGFSLDCKYWTRLEINGIGKHTILLRYSSNYGRKKF